MLLAAACIGPRDATEPPTSGPAVTDAPPTPTATSQPTAEPATPEPATTPPATVEPSVDPSASPSSDPAAAAVCAGSDDNREFFASIADVVDWPVYCPVLPSGWFVDSGQYRLAGGGWLEIAYRGPGGARLELLEGTACTDTTCLPAGDDLGGAAFGGLDGTMVRTADGRLAVVAGPSDGVTWVALGSGLAQDAFAAITSDLALVGD